MATQPAKPRGGGRKIMRVVERGSINIVILLVLGEGRTRIVQQCMEWSVKSQCVKHLALRRTRLSRSRWGHATDIGRELRTVHDYVSRQGSSESGGIGDKIGQFNRKSLGYCHTVRSTHTRVFCCSSLTDRLSCQSLSSQTGELSLSVRPVCRS